MEIIVRNFLFMCCSEAKTSSVVRVLFPTGHRSQAAERILKTPILTYTFEIKHCVLDSPHLLFGSFPCKVSGDSRLKPFRPVVPEVAPKFRIADFELLPPDGADARELYTLTGLA